MSTRPSDFYELLPAIIRERDAERGGPLQALLAVAAQQGKVFSDDLTRLYDNLFIETCDDWVVPYLGDLLGIKGLHDLKIPGFSQRARVAHTLTYRRRKGTASMLELLARDTTGWATHVVEFFEILETTQWLNHLRPQNLRTPDLRDTNALELIDTAFDTAAHTADVRHISSGRGRHNIPNLGIFLWRLQNYPLERTTARALPANDGRFSFDPLGRDLPLYNEPQTETVLTHLTTEINVPAPLRRRPLFDELEARRANLASGGEVAAAYFGEQPVLRVSVRSTAGGSLIELPPENIFLSDLSEIAPNTWRRPVAVAPTLAPNVAVDPVLGRLDFASGFVPAEVLVSCTHAFPGDLGGGPYDRRDSVAAFPLGRVDWQVAVDADLATDPTKNNYANLQAAVEAWNTRTTGTTGVISLLDNRSYVGDLSGTFTVRLQDGEALLIVSADWPHVPAPDQPPGTTMRLPGHITATNRRAHLLGNMEIIGTAPTSSESPGELWINGLLIEGKVTVQDNGAATLGALHISHSSIVPKLGGLIVAGGNESLAVTLQRSICGPLLLPASVPFLTLEESIVDAPGVPALTAPGSLLAVIASTIRGKTAAQKLNASDAIFTENVTIERRQNGCVRFCFVPEDSSTPRRYRCQPDLAVAAAKTTAAKKLALSRIVPMFTAEDFGTPAYLQLARLGAPEISTGADNGAEMGAWWFLGQPQRLANLTSSLDEYLRLGLEAGIILAS